MLNDNFKINPKKDPKRILIVRTDRIGDAILSTPVIKNIRLAYPKAYVAFMCRPYAKDIFEANPDLNEVVLYDKDKKQNSLFHSFLFSFYLRKKKFDWVIILHPTNRVHIISFLAGIPQRIGWDKKNGWLLTKKIPHLKQEGVKHEIEYTLDLLRALNIPIKDKNIFFPIREDSINKVNAVLEEKGVAPQEKIIIIHPCASCPSRRWPQNYFLQLIRLLQKDTKYKIAVISAAEDKNLAERLVSECGVIDLRGRLSLAETGALMKRGALLISNDSGPAHIAAAMETPVIAIFSRKNPGISPTRWKPVGIRSFYLHKDVGCRNCLAHNCVKEFLCLSAITPQEVFKKAQEILVSM